METIKKKGKKEIRTDFTIDKERRRADCYIFITR